MNNNNNGQRTNNKNHHFPGTRARSSSLDPRSSSLDPNNAIYGRGEYQYNNNNGVPMMRQAHARKRNNSLPTMGGYSPHDCIQYNMQHFNSLPHNVGSKVLLPYANFTLPTRVRGLPTLPHHTVSRREAHTRYPQHAAPTTSLPRHLNQLARLIPQTQDPRQQGQGHAINNNGYMTPYEESEIYAYNSNFAAASLSKKQNFIDKTLDRTIDKTLDRTIESALKRLEESDKRLYVVHLKSGTVKFTMASVSLSDLYERIENTLLTKKAEEVDANLLELRYFVEGDGEEEEMRGLVGQSSFDALLDAEPDVVHLYE